MLVFLQFIAVAVVNSTNVTSMVVRNYQISTELKMASHKVINAVLNNSDFFVNYPSYLNPDGKLELPLNSLKSSKISVTIISFKCLDMASLDSPKNCNLNNKYWRLVVQLKDSKSRAKIRVVQGIRLSKVAKNAPDDSSGKTLKILLETTWWYQSSEAIHKG